MCSLRRTGLQLDRFRKSGSGMAFRFGYSAFIFLALLDIFLAKASEDATVLPRFLEEPAELSYIVRGRPVSLHCKVLQATRVNFRCLGSWVNPEQHIRGGSQDPETGLSYVEASIDVLKEQLEERSGQDEFSCECYAWAEPQHQGSIVSRKAYVRIAYLRKHFEPHGPVSASVSLGSTAVLQCFPPLGDPTPEISWQKNGEPLEAGRDINYIKSNEGNLIVNMARLTDMANYSCVAENIAAQRLSEPAFLNVYVNGGWSPWGKWTECDRKGCGKAFQHRVRSCTNPVPLNEGTPCAGDSRQKMQCANTCPENGHWSSWSSWSTCGVDCRQHRRRLCDSPAPSNGGEYCEGSDLDTVNCTLGRCQGAVEIESVGSESPYSGALLHAGLPLAILMVIALVILGIVLLRRRHRSRKNVKGVPDVTKPPLTTTIVTYDKIASGYSTIDEVSETGRVPACLLNQVQDRQAVQYFRVTHAGGEITLPRSGVSMVIPEGAVSEGQSVEIFLGVLRDDEDRPKLQVGQTMLGPVVVCGPGDVVFNRPVTISFDHCASLSDSHWQMFIYRSVHSHERRFPPNWKLLTTVAEDKTHSSPFHVDNECCYISTDLLMRYALIGQKILPGWAIKFLRLAVFRAAVTTSPEHVLRVYVIDDTQDAVEGLLQVENSYGGHLVVDTKQITCHSGGANWALSIHDLAPGWSCRQSCGYQEIPLVHIWSGTHNYPHCSFTLDQIDSSQNLLSGNISVWQTALTTNIQQIPISYCVSHKL